MLLSRLKALLYSYRCELYVLAITAISVILKIYWVSQFNGPVCFFDEMLYRANAFSVFTRGEYATPHYPLAYPTVLSLSFFAQDWYSAMLVINSVISSLMIPAVWLLARSAGVSRPLMAAILSLFLPFHVVVPHLLLSENLFVPLFVVCCSLSIRGGRGILEGVLFGVVLALTHLTKYLFLPSIPVLFAVWLWATIRNEKRYAGGVVSLSLVTLATYLLIMMMWFVYGYASGFEWYQMLGLNLSGVKSENISLSSFVMWAVAYLSYFFLAALPLWGLVVLFISKLNINGVIQSIFQSYFRFFVLTLLLIGGYLLVAIQHSFGAGYNYPEPQYIIGRYLMHLMPLMIVLGMVSVDKVSGFKDVAFAFRARFISSVVLLFFGFCAWGVLFHDLIWNFPPWFSKISFNSVDLFVFDLIPVFVIALLAAIAPFVMIQYRVVMDRPIFLLFPYIVFLFVMFVFVVDRVNGSDMGRHAREIVSLVRLDSPLGNKNFKVYFDKIPVDLSVIRNGLPFWDSDLPSVAVERMPSKSLSEQLPFLEHIFVLSKTAYKTPARKTYQIGSHTYYVYNGVDLVIDHNKPVIEEYGPQFVTAGESFNRQESGRSAFWFRLSSTASSSVLFFDGEPIPLLITDNGFASASIRQDLVVKPRTVELSVYDPVTGLTSDPVEFLIYPLRHQK
ncbi:hypothetical protein Ptc2401_00329 [Prosthecochloris sp. CIB 2401]|nr:hypothetical protein Ptc2401_00329 [Prosthecochloris sp. CIB 2401]